MVIDRSSLQVTGLTVSVQQRRLLSEVSFGLRSGEILAVIGPNGAGKSSLLNTIAGSFSSATIDGEISLGGEALRKLPAMQRARRVATLAQQSSLNFPFLAEEVIGLGRMPHATGVQRDAELVREVAALLDVHRLLARSYPTLSGGEKQRVQLARVLVQIWDPVCCESDSADSRVLLLDEPLSALDIGHQLQVMEAIQRFASQGVAVLMVVHDINIAARYANKVLALKNGRQCLLGDVDQVLNEEALEALYDVPVEILDNTSSGRKVVLLGE